jgi:hypothetical protein
MKLSPVNDDHEYAYNSDCSVFLPISEPISKSGSDASSSALMTHHRESGRSLEDILTMKKSVGIVSAITT